MRIEKLSKGRNKKRILSITILLLAIGIIYITNSKAKYQVTQSVQIVNGKVNYSSADLNVIALHVQEKVNSETYNPIGEVPSGYYEVNTTKSYCKYPGDETEHKDIPMEYKDNKVYIGITKKGTKCYVYLDMLNPSKKTLMGLYLHSNGEIGSITGPSCKGVNDGRTGVTCYSDNKNNNMNQNGVYEVEDDFGTSYVFRGTVDNNWVKFGKMNSNQGNDANKDIWWRIIRINGNGTIRLIYAGMGPDAPATKSETTQIKTSAFNSLISDNRYVGFMYGNTVDTYENTHKNEQSSKIKTELEMWYQKTTLNATNMVDVETGFCNDRQIAPKETHSLYVDGTGKGTDNTAYAPMGRLFYNNLFRTEQIPTLKCGYDVINKIIDETARKRDLFTGPNANGIILNDKKIEGNNVLTNPVGLITLDEVIYAGGYAGQSNSEYWLYTACDYWTMSMIAFAANSANIWFISGMSAEINSTSASVLKGVRPVINLKADTVFKTNSEQDKGISTNPYIVQ